MQPVSETGYILASHITIIESGLFFLHCGNRFWRLIVINMMGNKKQKNGETKHCPTKQLNDPCKYNRHNSLNKIGRLNSTDEDLTSPGAQRKYSGETFQQLMFFSAIARDSDVRHAIMLVICCSSLRDVVK